MICSGNSRARRKTARQMRQIRTRWRFRRGAFVRLGRLQHDSGGRDLFVPRRVHLPDRLLVQIAGFSQ